MATTRNDFWLNIKVNENERLRFHRSFLLQSFFNAQNSLIILSTLCLLFLLLIVSLVVVLLRLLKKKRVYQNEKSKIVRTTTMTNPIPSSTQTQTQTQSFDHFENEVKRTWNEKNEDEVETVNEVLGMEERHGKIYYKVNFTGHPADYTAWVCEEDLIPE